MCILLNTIFIGGYDFSSIFSIVYYTISIISYLYQYIVIIIEYFINIIFYNEFDLLFFTILLDRKEEFLNTFTFKNDYILTGLFGSCTLGVKSSILIFTFIWVRASYPRIRFDQLMSYCWTLLLPILIGFIVIFPCLLYIINIIPVSMSLL
jgi:NADH-ubiquinone oxidoreductase chain 1